MRRTTKLNLQYPREPPSADAMRSFGGYCRIAFALGGASLRYEHNVRETFRNARFGRFRDVLGGGVLRCRATAWAYRNAPHRPSIRNCANARFFPCMRCLDWRLTQASHGKLRAPLRRSSRTECFIAGFFGKRPRSFVLCFRYSTMVITAIFERGTHARRSYQARRGI